MEPSENLEYCFVHYVPNVISGERISIAVVFFDPSDLEDGICTMCFAADWQNRVRLIDPHSDVQVLEATLSEVQRRLLCPEQRRDMIQQMEDSFSNTIQISPKRKCPVAATPGNIEIFARQLLRKASYTLPGLPETQRATC